MLRAIIIDDEESGISAVKLIIQKFIPDVKVVDSTTDSTKGPDMIENYRPEIVFLDINMPYMNGFEMLSKTSYKNFDLIFITAHSEFALQALKNHALDYILKPVDPEELKAAVQRVRDRQAKNNYLEALNMFSDLKSDTRLRIAIPVKNGIDYEYSDNIIRMEASSNYTDVFLANSKKHTVRKTLKEFESMLSSQSNFMRVHESHLVNLNYVIRYIKESPSYIIKESPSYIVTKDNANIPVSRQKKNDFLGWLKT
jgi:two-component system, LytTR family, response regulator